VVGPVTEQPEPTGRDARRAGLLVGRVGGVAGSLAAAQLIVGLTYVLAARRMEPADLGIVATCLAVGAISAIVFDMGLTNYLVRDIAGGRSTMDGARALVVVKRRVSPLIVVVTMPICLAITSYPLDGVVLGLLGLVAWEAQTANSLLRALEMFSRAAIAQLTARATGLAATVGLAAVIRPETALAIGLVLGFALEAVIDLAYLGRRHSGRADLRGLLRVNRKAASFGLVSLSAAGQQLDTPLVTIGGGLAAGGLYAAAGRLIGPMLFLSSSMALVGAPWLARVRENPDGLAREERRIVRLSLLLALAPLVVAAAGPLIIPWLLGPRYAASGSVFAVLAVGAALSTLCQGQATILQNRGSEKVVGRSIATGLVVGLVATLGLSALGGPVWAAVGYVVSQLVIVVHLGGRLHAVRRAHPDLLEEAPR
jgi:O-antigen/teichoic acid export membrane protein